MPSIMLQGSEELAPAPPDEVQSLLDGDSDDALDDPGIEDALVRPP
jgi:hypothetical protein